MVSSAFRGHTVEYALLRSLVTDVDPETAIQNTLLHRPLGTLRGAGFTGANTSPRILITGQFIAVPD